VAGIQSVYRRAAELDRFDIILIDEVHMVPPTVKECIARFWPRPAWSPERATHRLTATPYRMSTGMICGPENLLNEVCYEVGRARAHRRRYLCPLKSKGRAAEGRHSGLHLRGGEFVAAETEALMDDETWCDQLP